MSTRKPWARRGEVVVLLAACVALAGCGPSKLTKANYEKIKNDMTLQQVEEILGRGEQQGGDGSNVAAQVGVDVGGLGGGGSRRPGKEFLWESGETKITVTFVNDKVVGKSYRGKEK